MANTCGACVGAEADRDEASNAPCDATSTKKKAKKSIGIKISGVTQPNDKSEQNPYEGCGEHAQMSLSTNRCECNEGYTLVKSVCVSACPPHSSPASPGKCQCDPGFALDASQTACVLDTGAAGFATATAATSVV